MIFHYFSVKVNNSENSSVLTARCSAQSNLFSLIQCQQLHLILHVCLTQLTQKYFSKVCLKTPRLMFVCLLFFPYSGAQGEYAGLRVIRAYHEHNGNDHRKVWTPIITRSISSVQHFDHWIVFKYYYYYYYYYYFLNILTLIFYW